MHRDSSLERARAIQVPEPTENSPIYTIAHLVQLARNLAPTWYCHRFSPFAFGGHRSGCSGRVLVPDHRIERHVPLGSAIAYAPWTPMQRIQPISYAILFLETTWFKEQIE